MRNAFCCAGCVLISILFPFHRLIWIFVQKIKMRSSSNTNQICAQICHFNLPWGKNSILAHCFVMQSIFFSSGKENSRAYLSVFFQSKLNGMSFGHVEFMKNVWRMEKTKYIAQTKHNVFHRLNVVEHLLRANNGTWMARIFTYTM